MATWFAPGQPATPAAAAPLPPKCVELPRLRAANVLRVGDQIGGTLGLWDNPAAALTVQIRRDGRAIAGATSLPYTLIDADQLAQISYEVTATVGGLVTSARSGATRPVQATPPVIVAPPVVPLPTLALSGPLAYAANAAAGTLVANIGNVPAGATPTVTPNDGRLAVAGDAGSGWKVVTGLSASSAGTFNITVAAAGANPSVATAVTVTSGAAAPGIAATAFPTAPAVQFHPHSQSGSVTRSGNQITAAPDLRGLAALSGLGADGSTVVGPMELTDRLGRKFWRFNGAQYATLANTLTNLASRGYMVVAVVRMPHGRNTVNIANPRFATYTDPATNTPANGVFGLLKQTVTSLSAPFLAGPSSPTPATNPTDAYKAMAGAGLQVLAIAGRTTANGGTRYYSNTLTCDVAQATTAVTGYMGAILGAAPGAANSVAVTTSVNNTFDLYELGIYNTEMANALTDPIVAAAVSNWQTTNHDRIILLEGDSQKDGIPTALGAGDPEVDPAWGGSIGAQITQPGIGYVGDNVRVINLATSGSQTSNIVARRDAANSLASFPFPGGASRNKVVGMVGANDFSESAGKKNSATFYADLVAIFNTASTGYLQRGWSGVAVAGVALTAAAVTTNVSPANENTLQKRQEGVRALIYNEAGSAPTTQFLSDTQAQSGGTYAGLMTVLPVYRITDGGNQWFYDAVVTTDRWSSGGPYDSDDKHLVVYGHKLLANGGDTPQYGYRSLAA